MYYFILFLNYNIVRENVSMPRVILNMWLDVSGLRNRHTVIAYAYLKIVKFKGFGSRQSFEEIQIGISR